MIQNDNKISNWAIITILINVIVGAGVLTLPHTLAKIAGPDAWIVVLTGSVLTTIGIVLVVKLSHHFPQESIAQYSPKLIGKFLGFLLNMIFFSLLIILGSLVIRFMGDTVNTLVLRRTPLEPIMLGMLITCSFIVRNGLGPIAILAQLLFITIIIPYLILPFAWEQFQFTAFLPVLAEGFQPIIKGSFASLFAFGGFEVLLVISPFVKERKQFCKASLWAIAMITIFYLFNVVISIGVLTVPEVAKLNAPFLAVMKYLTVPIILERLDFFFFLLWIMATYTTIVILLYTASAHLADSLGLKTGKGLVWPICLLIFLVAWIPDNPLDLGIMSEWVDWTRLVFIYGVIPLLLLIVNIKKLNSRGSNKKSGPAKN